MIFTKENIIWISYSNPRGTADTSFYVSVKGVFYCIHITKNYQDVIRSLMRKITYVLYKETKKKDEIKGDLVNENNLSSYYMETRIYILNGFIDIAYLSSCITTFATQCLTPEIYNMCLEDANIVINEVVKFLNDIETDGTIKKYLYNI